MGLKSSTFSFANIAEISQLSFTVITFPLLELEKYIYVLLMISEIHLLSIIMKCFYFNGYVVDTTNVDLFQLV